MRIYPEMAAAYQASQDLFFYRPFLFGQLTTRRVIDVIKEFISINDNYGAGVRTTYPTQPSHSQSTQSAASAAARAEIKQFYDLMTSFSGL